MKTWKRFYAYKSARDKDWLRVICRNSPILSFCPIFVKLLLNDWINVGEGEKRLSPLVYGIKVFPFSRWRLIILVFNVAVVALYLTGRLHKLTTSFANEPNKYIYIYIHTYPLNVPSKIHVIKLTFRALILDSLFSSILCVRQKDLLISKLFNV